MSVISLFRRGTRSMISKHCKHQFLCQMRMAIDVKYVRHYVKGFGVLCYPRVGNDQGDCSHALESVQGLLLQRSARIVALFSRNSDTLALDFITKLREIELDKAKPTYRSRPGHLSNRHRLHDGRNGFPSTDTPPASALSVSTGVD
jgi:hypothetical protein